VKHQTGQGKKSAAGRRIPERKKGIMRKTLFIGIAMCLGCSHAQAPPFDAERAFGYLEAQCAFGPRIPGSEGHQACLKFLAQTFEQAGARVREQHFMHTDPWSSRTVRATNVIATFGTQKDRILLCAHWDTRPVADHDPDPENRTRPVPGANDGASGVAVLLEISQALSQHPPPVGVDIVLFDAEDSGIDGDILSWCKGSQYFARNLPVPYPQYAILIDMIGDRDLTIPQEGYSKQYAPELVDRVWQRARDLGLTMFLPHVSHYVMDDHVPLLQAGIPAVNLIDFDYPFWHTVSDTPDKCSPESLGAVGILLLSLIYE